MGLATPKMDVGVAAYFVPGVFVEVLWDIEEENREGRRRGERSVKSVWWRAEVTKVEQLSGKCKAELRYEGRDGFKEQCGKVWVFPRHIRLVGDDTTQLRWRFYESSGEVTYDMEDESETQECEGRYATSCTCDSGRVEALEKQLGNVMHQYETIEQLVVAQNVLFSRLMGVGSTSERLCSQLFSVLRQKIAVLMQRPIPPSRVRKDSADASMFFEENSAGILSVDVDCSYQTFAAVARIVRSKVETACFRPCFAEMQLPGPSLEEAEIAFASFAEFSRTIGVSSLSDVMRMTLRERGNCKKVEKCTGDVAVRLVGTCLIDTLVEESAMAILVCKSVHEDSLSQPVDAIIRESREYEFSSRTYRKPLISRTCTREELMRTVFTRELSAMTENDRLPAMRKLSSQFRNFTLRWRALSAPNSRTWSRKLAVSEFVNGIVEVDIPCVIFRGPDSVSEVMEVLTDSLLREQLKDIASIKDTEDSM